MRFLAILAAVAIASVSAQSSQPCNVTMLTPLLTDSDLTTCTKDSGIQIPPPPGSLTKEALTKACASNGCKGLLAKVEAMKLGDCTLATFKLETDLITPIKTQCAAGASGGSQAGSQAGTVNTTKPVTIGDTSSPTSSVPVATPKSTPAPTPKSDAGSLALTTGAVVVAAVATLW